ncbi:hypothetical protein [Mycoplasmopsis felifaucium]|uniref:hypothetical protein n=1 Tax=Mycoplasmopsis felifaucium TaxID=35768 RepID=UPI000481D2FB|nr:hypothetical protein [Mycoplasmopsis felifaucium]
MVNTWKEVAFSGWSIAIPISLALIVIISAIISGARRGIYGGVITAIFGISGWLIGVLASPPLIKAIMDNANFNYKEAITRDSKELMPFIYGLAVLAFQIPFCIIGGILILILRKKIKKPMEQLKKDGKTTVAWRSLGAIIATAGVIPCSVFVANAAGIISYNKSTNNTNNQIISALSFNKARAVSSYTPGLIATAEIVNNYVFDTKNTMELANTLKLYFEQFINPNNYIIINKNTGNAIYDSNGNINVEEAAGITGTKDLIFHFSLSNSTSLNTEEQLSAKEKLVKAAQLINDILKMYTVTNESFSILNTIFKVATGLMKEFVNGFIKIIRDIPNELINNAEKIGVIIDKDYKLDFNAKEYLNKIINDLIKFTTDSVSSYVENGKLLNGTEKTETINKINFIINLIMTKSSNIGNN